MEDNNYKKQKYGFKIITTEEELDDINKKDNIKEYKIVIVGNNLTGKTSFCRRFVLNDFDLEIKPSRDTDCYLKTIILFDKEIKIYLLDVETIPITPLDEKEEYELYKDINGIIAIYDITQYESFDNIEKLINNAKKKGKIKNNIPVVIVGNKNDLKFLRNIDFSEAKDKALNLGCELFEINCNKDEESAHNVMKNLISKIYFNDLSKDEKMKIINKVKDI